MEYVTPSQLRYKASLIVQADMMLIHTAGVIWIIKDILCKSRSGISVKYTVHVVYICCPCVGPSVTNALQMRTHFAFTLLRSFTQWAEEVDVDLTVDF